MSLGNVPENRRLILSNFGLPVPDGLARTFHENFSASEGSITIKPHGQISGLIGRLSRGRRSFWSQTMLKNLPPAGEPTRPHPLRCGAIRSTMSTASWADALRLQPPRLDQGRARFAPHADLCRENN
jgi:hypothetical protein